MKIVKISGKTWRDSKDFVILYHVSPNKLSSLQPLSKFERYTGLFMSDSYRSIIRDWAGYVINKKHKYTDVKIMWHKVIDEISMIEDKTKFRKAKNPLDQPKLDALLDKKDKIDSTLSKEEYQEAVKGYKTLYIHKIECPKEVYEQAIALFNHVYESGYRKDSFGFWGWGAQIFIPKNLLPALKIINVEKIDEAQLIKKDRSYSTDSYRAQKPSFKMTPEQKEEFDRKEKELRDIGKNTAMNKNWYKKARYEKDWNVIRLQPNLFQLQFKNMPIQDFYPIEKGNIKEVKTYGMNVLKLPDDIVLPPILFMYSRSIDFITAEKTKANDTKDY